MTEWYRHIWVIEEARGPRHARVADRHHLPRARQVAIPQRVRGRCKDAALADGRRVLVGGVEDGGGADPLHGGLGGEEVDDGEDGGRDGGGRLNG